MNIYKLKNKINEYYVVATDPTTAIRLIEEKLNETDYGFFEDRKIYQTLFLGKEIINSSGMDKKPYFSDGSNLLIQVKDE
jgi:hypothetical protein